MAAVQQSVEALTQERRAILKDLLSIINAYDKTRHDEVKDEFAKKAIRYFNMLALQQKNKADSLERADLLLSDLALETQLCLDICSDDQNRQQKIADIDQKYYDTRKFRDPSVPIDLEDQKARDEESLLLQIIMEFYHGIPIIAIRQQNKNMTKKVPDEIKNLVEKVLKEIEHSPKQKQSQYELSFNSILMDILNKASDAEKQRECEQQLMSLSQQVVHEIHNENVSTLADINKNYSDAVSNDLVILNQLPEKISKISSDQQGEYEIKFKELLTNTLNSAKDYNRQKKEIDSSEKEIDKAIANEKSKRFLRRVAIVSVGAVASVGLAALAVFTFGAALPHAIFLGGLGFTAMIKALEYSDDKSETKLQQLRLEKTNLIRKRNAVTVSVSDECTKFATLLDQQTPMKEPSPQENKHKRHRSLTIFPQSSTEEGGAPLATLVKTLYSTK